jgi:hypothetical protein
MKLASDYSFLTLENADGSSSHAVRISSSLKPVLGDWAASTRVSPIYGIQGLGTATTSDFDFRGSWYLSFLGPVHPERVLKCYERKWRVWLTLGLFNLLILSKTPDDKRKILRWARDENLECETWKIRDGQIVRVDARARDYTESASWRRDVARLYSAHLAPELMQTVKDYCPVAATALSRSERLHERLFEDLKNINDFIIDDLRHPESEDNAPYPTLGQLLNIHAGLTRFTSQTFSGTSRILETECHLRGHSLLGIGVASIGLAHLREFIQNSLGAARLPERFAAFERVTEDVPDLCELRISEDFWTQNHLGEIELDADEEEPQVPLLSYFSARDGFKSTLTTISAPLSIITSCNSVQWSLLTVSHELSHVLIRSILAELYPDLESESAINEALDLLDKGNQGANLLKEIQRLLLITIIKIDDVSAGRTEPLEIDAEILVVLLERWYREVQEILVHVFDFLYFYGGEINKYIEGIWVTWGTIPNITNRIREYVVRTICTALVNHLERPKAEEIARDQVVGCLQGLANDGTSATYVKRALEYISHHWEDEILPRVQARKDLVKMARAFLFSETIATSVRKETTGLGGGEPSVKEGYKLKPGYLELREISNPFHFLETFTKSKRPAVVESAWMLYVLAYCVNGNGN